MRAPPGETNPFSVLLLLALAAGGWWLYVFGPVYWDNLEVKDAVAKSVNQAVLEGDANAQITLLIQLNRTVGWHYQVDEETQAEQVKAGLGLEKEQVLVKTDSDAKMITVRVEYDRTFQLVPFKQRKTLHFVVLKQGKIQ